MMDVGHHCIYSTSSKSCLSQTASFMQWLLAMYSAFVVHNAMVGCFLQFHEMTPTPSKKHVPVVDCGSFTYPIQSAMQNPLKAIFLLQMHNLKSKVPFKYLIIRFTTIQGGGLAFNMNCLTVLSANAILVLVAIIAYMRDR